MTQSIEAKIPEIEQKINENSDRLTEQISEIENTLPQRLKNVEDKVPVIENGLDEHVNKLTLWLQSLDVKHVEIGKQHSDTSADF